MSTPSISPEPYKPAILLKRQAYAIGIASALTICALIVWPRLTEWLLTTDFLPHLYCYLKNPALIWTNVVADSLIGIAYLAISITLGYLGYKGRRDIPLPWMFAIFGLFIVACGGTHFMEVVTIWIPVYILSAAVKLLTAAVSLAAAVVLPFTVPQIFELVRQAKASQEVNERLRASEARKEALLQEIHHRVKNNLAVICSLFHLQSNQTKDEQSVQVFRDMERRVHSMGLVHESLYSSEHIGRIDFAEYASALAQDILSSHGGDGVAVRMKFKLEPVMMSIDLAVLCGLILNELISNACKHGFPKGSDSEIKLTLRKAPDGKCVLCVEDNGVGVPADLDITTSKSLGMRLVRSLTRQIRGSFELVKVDRGTSACLQFRVDQNGN
ncbi:MAG TPA: sensor histidine kinase [Terriglobales bacterium]|nr:sensor histidine kinase [Terriglobales bacterium]